MTNSRLTCFLAVFLILDIFTVALGQTIHFRTGDFEVDPSAGVSFVASEKEVELGHAYRLMTFSSMPDSETIKSMNRSGVELIQYVPDNTYIAKVPVGFNDQLLSGFQVVHLLEMKLEHKLSLELQALTFKPDKPNEQQAVLFQMFGSELQTLGNFEGSITSFDAKRGVGHAVLAVGDIPKFAALPNVKYVESEPPVGEPESDDGRNLHRSNMIDVDYLTGRHFDGSGVHVAVNDDGFVGPHIDFQGRIDQSEVEGDLIGNHGDGVAGIIGAAGNLNPQNRGMATGARLFVRQYEANLPGTVDLLLASNVVIFNTSYSNGCNAGYTTTTQLVDQEQFEHPALMQVFSAGNSNGDDCNYGAGNQWGNITGGHKIAKNCIAVANLDSSDAIVESSSRGPAADGRIKPDISAHGRNQMSTVPDNQYSPFGGTSAAAPGVAGVLAQLYQAYREMFLEEAPAALLKCVLLNTASDLGNVGPDFIYGWGKINAYRALRLLEDGRYTSGTVSAGETISVPIEIPAGVRLGKVMVYWADEEGTPMAATALVNDIDISVEDPAQNLHLPYVLDATPNSASLNAPATQGEDHLNNMEQVPLFNPAPGNYQLNITGTTVPFGAVSYFVCYEFLTDDITLTYPLGGEGWEPGTTERIHWDAYGNVDDFDIELSLDNGATWQNVATVSGDTRIHEYVVPTNLSSEAKIRVSRGGFSSESDTTFSIIGVPQNLEFSNVCFQSSEYSVRLNWNEVDGADSYDVFVLGEMYMDSVMTVDTTFADLIVPAGQVSWVSVRSRNTDGAIGRRAVAVPIGWAPGEAPCILQCGSDNDVGIGSIVSPSPYDLICLTGSSPVTVELENLGVNSQSDFQINFELDGQLVTDAFTSSIAAGGQPTFTFSQEVEPPSAPGIYLLKVWTELPGDGASCNDTLYQQIEFYEPLLSYSEDFEGNIFPPERTSIVNDDGRYTWEATDVTGSTGATTAMFVNNYVYNGNGAEDLFILPILDLQSAISSILTFDVAYRPYASQFVDRLKVQVSTDCGNSFQTVYSKSGLALSEAGYLNSDFSPTSGDWRTDTVDLSDFIGNRIMARFVNENGYGNNLYIDNINLNNSFVGVDEAVGFEFMAYPNPTDDRMVLDAGAPLSTDLTVEVLDILGRSVLTEFWYKGTSKKELVLSGLANGQYVIQLQGESIKSWKKVAKM